MKTNYESTEDQFFLEHALNRAWMATDLLFDPFMIETCDKEYIKFLIKLRAKIFEFMELKDPNQTAIELYFKDYL